LLAAHRAAILPPTIQFSFVTMAWTPRFSRQRLLEFPEPDAALSQEDATIHSKGATNALQDHHSGTLAAAHQLVKDRILLPTLELYANELKKTHQAWQERLSQAKPGRDPNQITSEALEIALAQMENSLPFASPLDESETLSLDEAMASILNHTSPA
jgi:hypothetical protein